MRDVFGADAGTISESSTTPAPDPNPPAMATSAAAAPAGPPVVAPTVAQAVDKALAKADADAVVATDPNAVHHVKLAATAPTVLGATAAGAGVGMVLAGPPGAAVGAGVGWVLERYQIGGGPIRSMWVKIKTHLHKKQAAAAAAAGSPVPASTPPTT